ncbi:MAG: GyrI-like domain-containing protein, partial [Anaerolineae bacterium]|nr:GyrI-like domain-containing protein [Anaerolineae bacterium]
MEQLPRLYRILALKELGLSLEQIRDLLENNLTLEEIRGMLRLKQSELRQHIAQEQARLAFVAHKLQQIEQEGTMTGYDVVLREVAPTRAAVIYGIVPEQKVIGAVLGQMFGELDAFLKAHNANLNGYGTTLYDDEEWPERDIHVRAAIPTADTLPENDRVNVEILPGGLMATVIHQGTFEKLGGAYDALTQWIESNGYRIVGSGREINLQFDPQASPDDYVTEIQFPVQKRA